MNDGMCPDCGGYLGDYGHCLNGCGDYPESCPACNGHVAYLGSLGMQRWFRCIDCGMDSSRGKVGQ